MIWVAVWVECPNTGIRGVHYLQVKQTLVHPLDYASNQEREKGYNVISAELWK